MGREERGGGEKEDGGNNERRVRCSNCKTLLIRRKLLSSKEREKDTDKFLKVLKIITTNRFVFLATETKQFL